MDPSRFETTLRETFNIEENLNVVGDFIAVLGPSNNGREAVSLAIGDSCLYVATRRTHGTDVNYELVSLTPLLLLAIVAREAVRRLTVISRVKEPEVYEFYGRGEDRHEIWAAFTSCIWRRGLHRPSGMPVWSEDQIIPMMPRSSNAPPPQVQQVSSTGPSTASQQQQSPSPVKHVSIQSRIRQLQRCVEGSVNKHSKSVVNTQYGDNASAPEASKSQPTLVQPKATLADTRRRELLIVNCGSDPDDDDAEMELAVQTAAMRVDNDEEKDTPQYVQGTSTSNGNNGNPNSSSNNLSRGRATGAARVAHAYNRNNTQMALDDAIRTSVLRELKGVAGVVFPIHRQELQVQA